MTTKIQTEAEKAYILGKANNFLHKSRDALNRAGDFGKASIDKEIYQAFDIIEQFISNACRNLEKF